MTTDAPDPTLDEGVALPDGRSQAFPASWENLLRLKNLVLEHDAGSTIFPTASEPTLAHQSLGVGARFTTLHWPAVEWAMARAWPEHDRKPEQHPTRARVRRGRDARWAAWRGFSFPFIGAEVPEGHQGQSVEGMSHGSVLSKLKSGFHRRRIAWGFNADHQPVGGKFDVREAELVRGCLLASYITFNLSPELAQTVSCRPTRRHGSRRHVPPDLIDRVRARVASVGLTLNDGGVRDSFWPTVWPALAKMKRRDDKYRAAREAAFTTERRTTLSARAVDRRAPGSDDSRNDGGDAVAVRGARHAHQFRGSRIRLSEEHAVPGQRRAPDAHRKTVGGVPRVRRQHRLSLWIGKVGRKLPGDGSRHRRATSRSRRADDTPTRWASRYRRSKNPSDAALVA